MLKVDILNLEGKKIGQEKLRAEVFGVEPNPELIQQAVVTQLANKRKAIAHTKTRGEVRGGGRKPWRQKGTGRARHGSIRSPIWRGGGVTFGPRNIRNFSLKMNKKARRKALFMSLTDKLKDKKIVLLDRLELQRAKTKDFLELIKKLPLKKSFLTILPKTDLKVVRATNNLKITKCIRADSLNIYDILRFQSLLMPKESLNVIYKTYLK